MLYIRILFVIALYCISPVAQATTWSIEDSDVVGKNSDDVVFKFGCGKFIVFSISNGKIQGWPAAAKGILSVSLNGETVLSGHPLATSQGVFMSTGGKYDPQIHNFIREMIAHEGMLAVTFKASPSDKAKDIKGAFDLKGSSTLISSIINKCSGPREKINNEKN